MKKHFTLHFVGRLIVLLEIAMCATWTLSVLMVNGLDSLSLDHLSLLLLVALTVVSLVLLKSGSLRFKKAVLWIAVLPLLHLVYEAASTFIIPYPA
jgi:hypothetical protein